MDPLFQVHRLNDLGQRRAGSVAKAFDELLQMLRARIEPGREMAICEMKLEEACFFAKKAIAGGDENQLATKDAKDRAAIPVSGTEAGGNLSKADALEKKKRSQSQN